MKTLYAKGITGEDVRVKVIDNDVSGYAKEVIALDGVWAGYKFVVSNINLYTVEEKPISKKAIKRTVKKASARISFETVIDRDCRTNEVLDHYTTAYVTVTAQDEEQANDLMEKLMEELEKTGIGTCSWCGGNGDVFKNRYVYTEGFEMDYCHGEMTENKEELKWAFKQAKKALGIR